MPPALGDSDVKQPSRLVQSGLHRRPADTGERRNLIDWKVTDAAAFDLPGHDA
jgi:hypothetical protein